MNLFRLLLLIGLAWAIWKLLQGWRVELVKKAPGTQDFLPMSRCASCGLHLPKEGLSGAGRCGACEKAGR